MNGRKAKLLRALAGVNKQTRQVNKYEQVQGTLKTKPIFHPTEINPDGSKKVLATYQTVTYQLGQCARKMNKILKRNYLGMLRGSKSTMLLA